MANGHIENHGKSLGDLGNIIINTNFDYVNKTQFHEFHYQTNHILAIDFMHTSFLEAVPQCSVAQIAHAGSTNINHNYCIGKSQAFLVMAKNVISNA